ncbi:MAG: helix-turn-helix domain-containing protein [Burkholderiales bacterium]|nr:helix-turn-helix domain-containing protein [Burkholderiales bacterium]
MNPIADSALDARIAGGPVPSRTDAAHSSYSDRTCRDADEHAASLREWDQTYDQISAGRFDGQVTDAWMGDVQVFRERTAPVTEQQGRSWPGACTLAVVMHAEADATFCGQALAPTDAAVFGAGGEFSLITPRRFDLVGIALPARLLRTHAARTGDTALATVADVRAQVLRDPVALAPMRTCARDWFDALAADPSLVHQPAVHASLVSSVLGVLTSVAEPAGGPTTASLLPDARKRLVERARAQIAARPDAPMTVAELCAEVGVSRRTLQYSFQQVLGVNPVQYLRAVRLNGVRRALKAAGGSARIGDIAARWGFWHLSQFSADYRRMFGELPSDTVRALG